MLENILSKKNDFIISIPTGGGKSILFQGPALYNSMFSNRLSIVITPLKALMEDQINGLVDKGFALNVDFLNSDSIKAFVARLSSVSKLALSVAMSTTSLAVGVFKA